MRSDPQDRDWRWFWTLPDKRHHYVVSLPWIVAPKLWTWLRTRKLAEIAGIIGFRFFVVSALGANLAF
jgi:hypothetical protein